VLDFFLISMLKFSLEFISLAASNGVVRQEKVHLVSLPADLKFLCLDSVLPVSFLVYSLCVVSASCSGFAPVSVSNLQSCRRCLLFLFLLPVPLPPVLSLFPGGAVQHELFPSIGRCSPLPSSCPPARDWLLLWCSVRKKVHLCSFSALCAGLGLGPVQQLISSWLPLSSRRTL
jgi:hypothetical protein